MISAQQLSANRADVLHQIASACSRTRRNPAEVSLIAVSKFHDAAAIEALYNAGQRDFGESYVQELSVKKSALAHLAGIRWHLIGHLQTNKAKLALQNADVFHALDSEKLIRELSRRAAELGRIEPWPVFIQINLDDEASKSGIAPDELEPLLEAALATPALKVEGLMCIPAPQPEAEKMRQAFHRFAELARTAAAKHQIKLRLSMGMSDDFGVAIEEGSDVVRVGSKIFGDRPQKTIEP